MEGDHLDGRSVRYQHRRPELLDAVADYVLTHGLAGLAMRPLAAAVKVSHGTLLRRRLADAAGVADSPTHLASLPAWWRNSTTTERLPVYRLLFEVFAQAARERQPQANLAHRSTSVNAWRYSPLRQLLPLPDDTTNPAVVAALGRALRFIG